MAEDKVTMEGRIETRLDRMSEDIAELKGGFQQMDKRMGDLSARMSSAESLQRWAIGLIITSWLTLVGLSVTLLSKMP
jgi:hypothetical protein